MARGKRRPPLGHRRLELDELHAILERAKAAALSEEDREKLKAAVDTLAFLTRELEAKGVSIQRLRKLLFGASTEKTSQVVGNGSGGTTGSGAAPEVAEAAAERSTTTDRDEPTEEKRKGHGRNAATAYRGAQRRPVPHDSLEHGDGCPDCKRGRVYAKEPSPLVRVEGMAPLQATVYERERLRCNLCGKVFTAESPPGMGDAKYDETVHAMIGLLKYGCGLPFHRIERLQRGMGIPLPAATQWELVHGASKLLEIPYEELVRQAAQGEVVHNDDTTMKILELEAQSAPEARSDQGAEKETEPGGRTGVFTSGIVSTNGGQQIALFFTGCKHAGENLSELLANRAAALPPPIQMCDALSHNTAGGFDTILANCNAHARRRFVDVADSFPKECRHVLETLRDVYRNDGDAKAREMSPQQRLRFHQAESAPLMDGLEQWLQAQLDQHKVEPNSGLGDAIGYMRKHWQALTLFLRVPGAPLDNNICERALKKAILHRKNSLFYKTQNGANVGDLFMSLIHTAELCKADTFDYLVALQRRHREVAESPSQWMPWNYRETLARLGPGPDPPG